MAITKKAKKQTCACKDKKTKTCQLVIDLKKFLSAAADLSRLRILYLTRKEYLTVTQIHETLGIPQNLASHHIAQLKKIELLNEKREGTFRYYMLNEKQMRKYSKEFAELFEIR
jgi:ArsR family transcriptional regulator